MTREIQEKIRSGGKIPQGLLLHLLPLHQQRGPIIPSDLSQNPLPMSQIHAV